VWVAGRRSTSFKGRRDRGAKTRQELGTAQIAKHIEARGRRPGWKSGRTAFS